LGYRAKLECVLLVKRISPLSQEQQLPHTRRKSEIRMTELTQFVVERIITGSDSPDLTAEEIESLNSYQVDEVGKILEVIYESSSNYYENHELSTV